MKRIITQEQMEGIQNAIQQIESIQNAIQQIESIQNAILQENVPAQIYVGIVQLLAGLPDAENK